MAQAFTWRLEASVHTPPRRYHAAMAHDSARGRTVLFGGYDSNSSTTFGDCWEWDGTDWVARFSQHYPPARWMTAMVYDASRQRLVLFGGFGPQPAMADTWEFDGIDWQQRIVAPTPAGRFGHAMAYDSARQRTVLFGGLLSQSGSLSNQTWEWDGTVWVLRTPGLAPSARSGHGMAYDPIRQRTVLFGGSNANPLADTWEWDGTNW
ncbi:MAG: peptidase S8, partial [Planctomycetes bacterium]|nr:peptidase S8 [Planctomycetota bacterium]